MDKVYLGKVVWFNNKNGYGFISYMIDGLPQKDMFCHYTCILSEGYKTLEKDQQVQFRIGKNLRGQPIAVDIDVIKN